MPQPTATTSSDLQFSRGGQPFQFVPSKEGTRDLQSRTARLTDILTLGAPAVVAGMVDTFGTSLGIIDDGDVESWLKDNVAPVGDFYQRDKQAVRTVSDLTGMFIPGMLAMKGVTAAGPLVQGMLRGKRGLSSRLLSTVFTNAAQVDRAKRFAQASTTALAAKGTLNLLADPRRRRLVKAAKNFQTTGTIRDTVSFELGVLATMNNSDVLYPDQYSTLDLIALNSVLPGVVAVGQRLALSTQLRRHAIGVAATATAARNPADLPLDQVINRPGARDLKLVNASLARQAAKEAMDTSIETEVRTNFNRDLNIFEAEMKDATELLGRDNILPGVSKSVKLTPQQTLNVLNTEREFPGTTIGTMSIQDLPTDRAGVTKLYTSRQKSAEKLQGKMKELRDKGKIKEADEVQKQMKDVQSSEFHVLDHDGVLLPLLDRSSLYQDVANPTRISKLLPKARTSEFGDFRVRELKVPSHEGVGAFTARMSEDGLVELSPAIDLATTGTFQASALYRLGQDTADKYVPNQAGRKIIVPENASLFQLDYVAELYARHGESVLDDVVYKGQRASSIDEITFDGLNKKFTAYNQLRDQIETRLGADDLPNFRDIEARLNLPRSSDGNAHPLTQMFEHFRLQGDTSLRTAVGNMENMKRGLQEDKFFPSTTPFSPTTFDRFRGQMMNIPRDIEPSLLVKRPVEDMTTQAAVERGFEFQRGVVHNTLNNAGKENAFLVKSVFDELTQGAASQAARTAQNVEELIEGTRRGSGHILTQPYAVGETPALQAMKLVEDLTDKQFRNQVGKIFAPHNQKFAELFAKRNEGHLEAFNLYVNMRRSGWDLKPGEFVDDKSKLVHFVLEDTATNQKRFQRLYGRPMEEGELAPTIAPKGEYKPLAITEMALDVARSVDEIDEIYRANTNVLAKSYAQRPVNKKAWHVPPKNFKDKPAVVVLEPNGNVHTVVDGRTLADANKKADEIIQSQGPKSSLVKADYADVQMYDKVRDQPWEKMADFTDVLQQTGRAKGTSVSTGVVESGPGVLRDIIGSQQAHFESILRRTRATFFEPQVGFTRQMLARSGDSAEIRRGETVWQQYNNSVFGNQSINPNDYLGKLYFSAEDTYDMLLNSAWDKLAKDKRFGTLTNSHRNPDKLNAKLTEQLGDFNPFRDSVDFAERTHKVSPPPSMKKHMANLNWFTSLLTLRLLDVSHSLLTTASLGATIPGVVRGLTRAAGESADVWKARIGAFGIPIDDAGGAMFHPTRALTSGTHFMFSKEGREIWREAADRGFMAQQVSEEFATLTAPKQGYVEGLIKKQTDRFSMLSDKSEEFARGFSFMTGYNIAKRGLGIQNKDQAMAFAHKFANDTIGNYNPNARPRMFQGAVGMPLGLFMTFMQNYYQRLFGYIENKQTAALVTQFATQAAVFGGQTVPGFQQFSEFFASNYDGSQNLVDGMRNTFGGPLGDIAVDTLLYGALSNLTQTSLFQRGDVTIRSIPTVFNIEDTPNAAVISNFYQAARQGVSLLREQGQVSGQQVAEILGAYSTNRFVRNTATMYAGQPVDKRGAVVGDTIQAADVLSDMGVISRLVGLRPLSEAKRNEAFYRVRATEASQRERLNTLRFAVRSDTRAGRLTPERLQSHAASYVQYGGSPSNFAGWLVRQQLTATVDRTKLKLMETAKQPQAWRDTLRLMSAFDLGSPDAEFGP